MRFKIWCYGLLFPILGPAIGFAAAMLVEVIWVGWPDGGVARWIGFFTSAYLGGVLPALIVGLLAAWQLVRRGRSSWVHLMALAAVISLAPAVIAGGLESPKLITMLLTAGLSATVILRACERWFR